jgi:hypothetical protein
VALCAVARHVVGLLHLGHDFFHDGTGVRGDHIDAYCAAGSAGGGFPTDGVGGLEERIGGVVEGEAVNGKGERVGEGRLGPPLAWREFGRLSRLRRG